LLLESLAYRATLVALIPEPMRARHDVAALLTRLAAWQDSLAPDEAPVTDMLATLSAREREVLGLLAAGDSNQQIADTLSISLHTVKRHVVNVLAKLGCDTRGQAAACWHAARH
jgi:LuxR family transcriptional regulator, maltose regulon positive regulatory protein